MVFIKFVKKIQNQNHPMYCLFTKVIQNQTLMVFSKTLYVFENQAIIDYFIKYRVSFKDEYMLKEPLEPQYKLIGVFNADIDVQIEDCFVECQNENKTQLNINNGGKKLSLSIKKVQQENFRQRTSILIVQHPLCINFYLLNNKEFKQIMDLQSQYLIISFSILNNQLIVLNEYNVLEVYYIQFGILESQKELKRTINLNEFDQMFFKITQQYIHGQRSVLQINEDDIIELIRYQNVKNSQPIDLEQLDDRMSDFRNMKVYQFTKDSWVFVYKQYDYFAYSQKSIYKILNQMTINTMVLSKFKYQKQNNVKEDYEEYQEEYQVEYKILLVAGIDNTKQEDKYYINAYQWLQSQELQCTILIPLINIIDLKNEIDYIEFLNQYDVIFKDEKGRVGIIQYTVEEFGEVLLQY